MSARHFNRAPRREVALIAGAAGKAPAKAAVEVRAIMRPDGATWYGAFLGAEQLGRTVSSVSAARDIAHMQQLRLDRLRRQRKRPCLCCNEPFLSEGAHNRMCERCHRAAAASHW